MNPPAPRRTFPMTPPPLRPKLARRIVWEAEAVRTRFPGRFRLTLDPTGAPCWQGTVPAAGRPVPLAVTHPAAYPAAPPPPSTTVPLPRDCPHVLGRADGVCKLCWIAPHGRRRRRRRWDPQRHTAATVLRAAQRWALAFLVWQATGTWPVP